MSSPTDPFRHIMVATDFSEASHAALRWAATIAGDGATRVSLVHAVQARADREIPSLVTEDVRRQLAVERDALSREGVDCDVCFRPGRPWEVVVDLAVELGSDLVLLGRRGRSRYTRVGLGSTADRVIRKSPAPVLTVRRAEEPAGALAGPVLIATDFSVEAGGALEEAVRFVRTLPDHPRFVLLHACDFPLEYGISAGAEVVASARAEEAAEASRRLEEIAVELRADGLDVEPRVIEGYPATVIEEHAETIGAGLIVLGTQGRSGLSHLMLGSIAERVLHHTAVPVLTVNRTVAEAASRPHASARASRNLR